MKDLTLNLSRWISNQVMMIIFLLTSSSYYADAQLIGGSSYDFYRTWDMIMAALLVAMVFAFYLIGIFFIFIRCCSESAHFTEASHTPTHHHPAFLASPGRLPQLHRQQPPEEQQQQRGLDPEAIDAFALFQYSEVKNVKIGREVTLECAVCLSEFEDNETLRLMPKCNHVFHHQCVDAWLATHVTCPVCRANLSPENDTDLTRTAPQHTAAAAANDNLSPADQSNAVMLQSDQVVAVDDDEERKTRDSEVHQYRTEMSGLSGYFRSHSTGHAMDLLGDSTARFTLRLPENVSINEISENWKLRRTMSFNVVLAREGSSEKGEGSSGGKASDWSDWWGNVCRRGSVKPLKGDNYYAESSNGARNKTFLPLTSPLDGKGNPQGSIRPSV